MPRPRAKVTKACQTDTLFMTEDQVQSIITRSISHMRQSLEKLQAEVDDLKSTNRKLTEDNEALNYLQQATDAQLEQVIERLDSVEDENRRLIQKLYKYQDAEQESIQKMKKKIDDLEQTNKMNHLRIAGMDEEQGEDVQSKVINIASNMRLTLKPNDISDVRRMGQLKPDKARDILVKFTSSSKREEFYRNRKLLRQRTKPVYVNEDLTQSRSQLFYEARRLRKQGQIFGAWSQQGNVLIKVREQSQPREISNYKEMTAIVKEQSNMHPTNTELDHEASSLEGTDCETEDGGI